VQSDSQMGAQDGKIEPSGGHTVPSRTSPQHTALLAHHLSSVHLHTHTNTNRNKNLVLASRYPLLLSQFSQVSWHTHCDTQMLPVEHAQCWARGAAMCFSCTFCLLRPQAMWRY